MNELALVVVESELYGDTATVAVKVYESGCVLELPYLPPFGTSLVVRFLGAGQGADEIAFRSTVVEHRLEGDKHGQYRRTVVRFEEAIHGGVWPEAAPLAH